MNHNFLQLAGKAFISYLTETLKPFSTTIDSTFPIYINNTGDEVFLSNMQKGTKTDTIYSTIPRMSIDIKDISILFDQLSSNRITGNISVENNEGFKETIHANVKRIPLSWTLETTIYFNNVFEYLTFIEIFLTVSHHNHVFSFYWGGSQHQGTFLLQDDLSNEVNMSLAFDSDKRSRKMPLTFVIYLQYPSFDYYPVGQHTGINTPISKMYKLIHNMHVDDESENGIVSTIEITKP